MKTRTGHLFKRNGIFYVQWRIDGKLFMQSTGTRDIKEAERKRAEIMAPFVAGNTVSTLQNIAAKIGGAQSEIARMENERNPGLNIADAWTAFEKAANRPDSGPATLDTYGLQWGCFTRWLGETKPAIVLMRDVSKKVAGEYAGHLSERGVTANTFNKHIRVCELVFRVLKDKARIMENPFSEIQRKRLMPQHHRELTTEELRTVCQSAEGELRLLLALGLYLGARLGDAALMEWGTVDVKKGFVRYMPRKTARRSGKVLTVPLHPVLLGLFSEIPPPERKGFILPGMAKLYTDRGPYAVARVVQSHFEKCGLQTKREGNGVRKVVSAGFHSLRHSAVTLLREAGAPLSVTMAIVGHSTLAMHDTYTHAGESALKQAVAALPHILGDAQPVKALPAPRTVSADSVRDLAGTLTGKTWRNVKTELEKLAGVGV